MCSVVNFPQRVEPVGVVAEHSGVPVHRRQVDHDLVAGAHRGAVGELEIGLGPAHRHGAGRLQPDRLMRGALAEEPVGARLFGGLGVFLEPGEDVVHRPCEGSGAGVCPGQHVEGHLPADDLGREVEVVLVADQHAQYVGRQVGLGRFAGGDAVQDRPAAFDARREELLAERCQRAGHLGRLGGLVAGVVRDRGALDEQHEVVVEAEGLLRRAFSPVHARGEGGQVHHQLMAEAHQFGAARRQVRRQGLGEDGREEVLLVVPEGVAPEQAVLQAPTVAVLGAVQVDEHIGHDHVTLVVGALAQVAVAVALLRHGEGVDGDGPGDGRGGVLGVRGGGGHGRRLIVGSGSKERFRSRHHREPRTDV